FLYQDTNGAQQSNLATVTLAVNSAKAATAVTSSALSSVYGQAVTFTATVAAVAPAIGTPSGVVTFFDGNLPLGSQMLDASGKASGNISTLVAGTHSITVAYGG